MFKTYYLHFKKYPIQLYASSLTFYSLIALVPLLAFWLGLLEYFHIDTLFHWIMHGFLEPMGQIEETIGSTLFDFVHNTHKSIMKNFTIIFFFLSIIVLVFKIDSTVNQIHGIVAKFDRHFAYRWISLTVWLILGSIFIQNISHTICYYLFIFFTLTLMFKWIPRSSVSIKNAIKGSLFCLVIWFPISRIFGLFIYWNDTYLIVFHNFVGFIIMLFWINMLWLILLLGAIISNENNVTTD
ncbi:YihY/virulence factor BrkB family protein [Ursidibacter arcticus]